MTFMMPWLYVSTSRIDPQDAAFQVARLVSQSRTRNAALCVTGALIYSGTRFLQYIEGPPDAVRALQASILRDDRHEDLIMLEVRENEERLFGCWALAFSGQSHFIESVIDKALSQHFSVDGDKGSQVLGLLKQLC